MERHWIPGPVPLSQPTAFWPTQVRAACAQLLRDPSVRAAGLAFLLSRALVLFVFLLATHVTIIKPASEFGRSVTEMQIRIRRTSLAENFKRLAYRSDGGWYLAVAQQGYEAQPFDDAQVHNWAFFPLYPLLVRAAATLTGEYALTAIALSHLLFFLALLVLHKLVLAFDYTAAVADRTVLYLALFPTSYFFSLPWTTSLFLLVTVASFLFAKHGQWWWAGLCGGLAAATRYNGIFLFPALVILYWQLAPRPFKPRANVLGLLLVPAGLLTFMAYLYTLTGNALAFANVQAAWRVRFGLFLQPLLTFIISPFTLSDGWNFRLLNFAAGVLALGCSFVMLRRREWAWAFYTLISVVTPLSTVTTEGLARYVIVLFPVFIKLATMGEALWIDQTLRLCFITLLTLMTAFFGFFFGAALI